MMKALAAMRGPLSFTAVEFCKCQHQTVVDLVDLAGTESLAVLALRAVQVVPDPEFRAGKTMIGQPARVVTTIAPLVRVVMMTVRVSVGMMRVRLVRVEMMIVRLVRVVMMTVRVSVGMMRVRRVHVVMMIVRLVRVVMMTVRVSVGMMRVRLVRVVMMIVRLVHLVRGLQHSRRPMKFVTVAAVGA
jgi:hypothetical protein